MSLLTLPGLIDPHVHLREPGQTHKEDLETGSKAAIAGGFTTILDMPNNSPHPTTMVERVEEKIKLATGRIRCDIGFHLGSLGDNTSEFERASNITTGLKLYLEETTGGYIISPEQAEIVFKLWPQNSVVLIHAEESMLSRVIDIVRRTRRRTHICHVSSETELRQIIQAKEEGLPITCGVTPHHLFLTDQDEQVLGPYGKMKPSLKSKNDRTYLWQHLDAVDVIESDHAPHTKKEKESEKPPFGVPGLETTLPLLITEVESGRLTIQEIVEKCFFNPVRIFRLPTDSSTSVEVETMKFFTIDSRELQTKCGWTPFDGAAVRAKVRKVLLRGELVFEEGEFKEGPKGKVISSR